MGDLHRGPRPQGSRAALRGRGILRLTLRSRPGLGPLHLAPARLTSVRRHAAGRLAMRAPRQETPIKSHVEIRGFRVGTAGIGT